jgi:polyisoprenoid-binding protein YceI
MTRKVVGWGVAIVLATGGAAFAWVWFAGGSGEPSTELTTPDIVVSGTTTTLVEVGTGDTDDTTQSVSTFVIDAAASVASFEIDEVLRGQPTHVIGETDQVAGQVQVSLDDLSASQFSPIVINARTFRTDQERRDRAIRGPIILNSASDEHEFITFEVTSVDGLEGVADPGSTIEFSITGDLTIRGTTNTVTFEAEVTLEDESTLQGSATANILRSDFGIGIPSVASVAEVTDEVVLNLEFVAISA